MTEYNLNLLTGIIIIVLFLFLGIYLLKKFSNKVNIFIKDTLKEKQSDGYWKWSITCIMTVTAWKSVLIAFFYDMVHNGFNEISFFGLIAVATGAKVMSAKAKQIDPLIQPPKDETRND